MQAWCGDNAGGGNEFRHFGGGEGEGCVRSWEEVRGEGSVHRWVRMHSKYKAFVPNSLEGTLRTLTQVVCVRRQFCSWSAWLSEGECSVLDLIS